MKEYGTNVIAGVTPGREGSSVEGIPVYDTVKRALREHPSVSISVVFVPPQNCRSAVLEALDAGIPWVVVITEGMPIKDTLWLVNFSRCMGSHIIGPNCPGILVPDLSKVGIIPGSAFTSGEIGLVSRSGTLTYEVGNAIKTAGMGVSTAVGIGGDPIVGTTMLDIAEMFESDDSTRAIVVLGEIGGNMEEDLASAMESGIIRKPVISFIAGITAPPGKRMGHAGAILQAGGGTAKDKLDRLRSAGAHVAITPWEIPAILGALL
jgi:succinyl-CoA synthetase alpha subunit